METAYPITVRLEKLNQAIWLDLPQTAEVFSGLKLTAAECVVRDVRTTLPKLTDALESIYYFGDDADNSDLPDLSELNYLASIIQGDFWPGDHRKYSALLDSNWMTGSSLPHLINMALNRNSFEYIHGIVDDEALGRYVVEELGAYDPPGDDEDYVSLGKCYKLNEGGSFTAEGFLREIDHIRDTYRGKDDIPERYRLTMPEPERKTVREQLTAARHIVNQQNRPSVTASLSRSTQDREIP